MNFKYDTDLLVLGPAAMLLVLVLRRLFDLPERLPRWNRWLSWLWLPALLAFAYSVVYLRHNSALGEAYMLFVFTVILGTLLRLRSYRPARTLLVGVALVWLKWVIKVGLLLGSYRLLPPYASYYNTGSQLTTLLVIGLLVTARAQKKTLLKEQKQREEEAQARALVAAQNAELERLVAERTAALTQQSEELRKALDDLQTTQSQLIQAEKMASLGELTAGVAHEIQNPLNFVNNFAEVSTELLDELASEQTKPAPDLGLEAELLADLQQNIQKITHHGQRAASIVRGMLEHSRQSTGERTLTDLNALCDEYLRLAYHGLRAKDKTFNATLQTDFAPVLPLVEAVSQDLGRVLLNLFTNAFYAVRQRQQAGEPGYAPTVRVCTKREGDEVVVCVRDNGTGIAEAVQQKIFQPFFTTKPAGEGTGLGLSLSYDIVVQGHDGTLEVESQEGNHTEFVMRLPLFNY
ncbi:sensor histidine kinase [Hymenobacter bucti]|uniref:histidine kinase n=1 Tax=Hymenobacter bucti TaxID=1844114 RepID=A0ABW4QVT4_9BACT